MGRLRDEKVLIPLRGASTYLCEGRPPSSTPKVREIDELTRPPLQKPWGQGVSQNGSILIHNGSIRLLAVSALSPFRRLVAVHRVT